MCKNIPASALNITTKKNTAMSTQIETNLLLQENGYPNRRPSPDYEPVLTISESGMPILETVGDIVMPADYSFECINNYVHCEDPIYEELQSLALGMASHIEALQRQLAAKDAALGKIERWQGEFPNTGRTWDDGSTMSYAACYGSNGERDYMRKVAREGLAAQAGQEPVLINPFTGQERLPMDIKSDPEGILMLEPGAPMLAAQPETSRFGLQADGKHPAPCARHCESNAYEIELKRRDMRIAELEAHLGTANAALHATLSQQAQAGQESQHTPSGWRLIPECPYSDESLAILWHRGFNDLGNMKAIKGSPADKAWLEGRLAANTAPPAPVESTHG